MDALEKRLFDELAALRKEVEELRKGCMPEITWQDRVSDSGIQLQGGPTTVERKGRFLGLQVIPLGPGKLALQTFALRDDGIICPIEDNTTIKIK